METNEEENVVELRKIPLAGFIDMLEMLYDKGADYVDIIAKPNQVQDVLSLVIREDYVDPYCNGFTGEEDDVILAFGDTPNTINPTDLL